MKNEFTGCGPFLHDDPRDRPVALYGGTTTIHLGGGRDNFVLLPIIPPRPIARRTRSTRRRPPRAAARAKPKSRGDRRGG
jgi:hypothetical protein